jgi:hypothetical protein
MSIFKKTKVVYAEESGSDSQEILVDAVVNLEQVCAVLPGRKPGYLVLMLDNKMKYVIKDNIKSLLEREKKGNPNDKLSGV